MIKQIIFIFTLLFATYSYADECVDVSVNGMVCDFCARSIDKLFSKKDEVKDIDVDLDNGKIVIDFLPGQRLQDSIIKKLVTDSGFDVVDIKSCNV